MEGNRLAVKAAVYLEKLCKDTPAILRPALLAETAEALNALLIHLSEKVGK